MVVLANEYSIISRTESTFRSRFGMEGNFELKRMIRKSFIQMSIRCIAILFFFIVGTGKFAYALSDTLEVYTPSVELFTDTLDIGPDFFITDSDQVPAEGELPAFAEMLNQFVVPFRGNVVSKFGMRRGRMHTGTDIKLSLGDTVVAAYQGVVSRSQTYYAYGKLVIIDHPYGLQTYYAHLSDLLVKVGDTISVGQTIGLGGRTGRATGTHLHFEIRENGKAYNPELIFDFEQSFIKSEIEGKEMIAELVSKPKTGTKYVRDMDGTPDTYKIRQGDTLSAIARQFQVTVNELCELNNLTTRSILRIGMVIRIY